MSIKNNKYFSTMQKMCMETCWQGFALKYFSIIESKVIIGKHSVLICKYLQELKEVRNSGGEGGT